MMIGTQHPVDVSRFVFSEAGFLGREFWAVDLRSRVCGPSMDGSPGRDGMRRPEAPLAYRRDEPQVPPLRFAPVRMTIQWISGEKNMARLESRAVSNPYL